MPPAIPSSALAMSPEQWRDLMDDIAFVRQLKNLKVATAAGDVSFQRGNNASNLLLDLRGITPTGATVQSAIPSQTGHEDEFLQTTGNSLRWAHAGATLFTHVSRVAAQSISNVTDTAISFDTAVENAAGLWVSGSQVTVSAAGIYLLVGQIAYATNAMGIRYAFIEKNGVATGATESADGMTSGPNYMSVARPLRLVASDVVELMAYQSSGGALNVTSADFFVMRIGD
jgi:transketolase C-terminal domain/subunit